MKGRQTRLDQYFTSRAVVDRHFKWLLNQVSMDVKSTTIFDPFAGDGAYERGAARAGFVREVIAYDIDPKHLLIRQGNFFHATALDPT